MITNPSLIQEIKKQISTLENIVLHHYKNRNIDCRNRKLVSEYIVELISKRKLLNFIIGGF
jgi:hypothetical protein